MFPHTRILTALLALVFVLGGLPTAWSAEARVKQVKAAFVLNIARFSSWPEASFVDGDSPVRLCLLDESLTEAASTIDGKMVAGRHLKVDVIKQFNGGETCHLLFIGSESLDEFDVAYHASRFPYAITIADLTEDVSEDFDDDLKEAFVDESVSEVANELAEGLVEDFEEPPVEGFPEEFDDEPAEELLADFSDQIEEGFIEEESTAVGEEIAEELAISSQKTNYSSRRRANQAIVKLVRKNEGIGLEIAPDQARNQGLGFSSQLLDLARIVGDGEEL